MSSPDGECDVLVVGAGLAGLRCASLLAAAGRDVAVWEAGDQVGGRVRTDVIDGFRCDRGFQVLNPAYPELPRAVDVSALRLQSFDAGVAIRRGPLVYCLEGVDNEGVDVLDVAIGLDEGLHPEPRPDLLGGVTVLEGLGTVPALPWAGGLYQPLRRGRGASPGEWREVPITAIPYYAWANRGVGQMQVWLKEG